VGNSKNSPKEALAPSRLQASREMTSVPMWSPSAESSAQSISSQITSVPTCWPRHGPRHNSSSLHAFSFFYTGLRYRGLHVGKDFGTVRFALAFLSFLQGLGAEVVASVETSALLLVASLVTLGVGTGFTTSAHFVFLCFSSQIASVPTW
jgi:hypothetical protein